MTKNLSKAHLSRSGEREQASHLSTEMKKVHIYAPNQDLGWGLGVWREMTDEIWRSRELTWRLFVRDFSARYKQSVLGILWAVIMPLATMGTFVVLNNSGIMDVGNLTVPYPIFLLLGLTAWRVFAVGVAACSNSLILAGSMVVKINFPKETLVCAALGRALVETMVSLVMLVIVCGIYRFVPPWSAFLFPVVLLPMFILTLGLGLLLALANAFLRDIANLVSLTTTMLMLLTPVLYPSRLGGVLGLLTQVNPLAVLVTAARDVVLTGYLTQPLSFAWATILSIVILLVSWRIFHLVESRIAERI